MFVLGLIMIFVAAQQHDRVFSNSFSNRPLTFSLWPKETRQGEIFWNQHVLFSFLYTDLFDCLRLRIGRGQMLTSGLKPISSKKYFLVNLYIKISAIDWPLRQLRYKIKEMIPFFFFSFFFFSL